jgi:hypothetical protein
MGGNTVKKPFRFNLQLFADAAETGAEDTGAADQQAVESTEPSEAGSEPQAKEKDPSKAFAARLGHERKKMEAEYAPYRSVIERQAKASGMEPGEYLQYLQEQQEREDLEAEADRTGKTPEQIIVEREAQDAKAKLAEVERRDRLTAEEKELTSDPKIGHFVSDNLEKIKEIAESAGVDLRTGLAIVVTEKLPELLDLTKPEPHIRTYLESLKAGGKPIEIGGGATAPSATPPKTFEDARKAAIEKLRL